MRFVPTNCLREGMILADNLYNNYGELLLSGGLVLNEDYLKSIRRLKYNGIYIDDDISKDIPVLNMISETIKAKTVKGIRDVFIQSENGRKPSHKQIVSTKAMVEEIIEQILSREKLMVNVVDMKVFDDYTYYHSVNVAVLAIVIGVALGMERQELCELGYAALLHDIGKVFIKKDILNKPGKLNREEFEEMKKHSLLGCEHIKRGYGMSELSVLGILDHHERYDGDGYPNNIRENRISRFGRIISIVDVYDALTSDRPYRSGLLPAEAMEYIMASSGTLFDPELVQIFARKIAPYSVGSSVLLSNGNTAIVMENYEELCMRPRIRVYQEQGKDVEPYEIDLSDYRYLNITIVEVV